MKREIRVEIAGIGILFRYKNCQIIERNNRNLYIKNFIKNGKSDFVIDIEVGGLPKYSTKQVLFRSKENWNSYIYNGSYIFEAYYNYPAINKVCFVERNFKRAKAYLLPRADEFGNKKSFIVSCEKRWSLENFMQILGQVIFIGIVSRYQGILIHSSGIIFNPSQPPKTDLASGGNGKSPGLSPSDECTLSSAREGALAFGSASSFDKLRTSPERSRGTLTIPSNHPEHSRGIRPMGSTGEGVIFCGISGAGKTTLAKLCQNSDDITVLNDDRIAVRKIKNKYFVYGTPWPGEGKAVSCKRAILKKIVFLSKAEQNKIIPLNKKDAFYQIITQCFPAIWDKDSIDFCLKFCEKLIRDIPCFQLAFVPDSSAVEFIENRIVND